MPALYLVIASEIVALIAYRTCGAGSLWAAFAGSPPVPAAAR